MSKENVVIPAKAGIQKPQTLDPGSSAGMTIKDKR